MVVCYILRSCNHFYYCGISKNLSRRIAQHNCGNAKSTKAHRPLSIVFVHTGTSYMQMRILEKQIKNAGVKAWYDRNVLYGKNPSTELRIRKQA